MRQQIINKVLSVLLVVFVVLVTSVITLYALKMLGRYEGVEWVNMDIFVPSGIISIILTSTRRYKNILFDGAIAFGFTFLYTLSHVLLF